MKYELIPNADTKHVSAQQIYNAIKCTVQNEIYGDLPHTEIDYPWLEQDNAWLFGALQSRRPYLTYEEVVNIIHAARQAEDHAIKIENRLKCAVESYSRGFTERCIEYLDQAALLELRLCSLNGTPASHCLWHKLIRQVA